jgi:hypothetical protein
MYFPGHLALELCSRNGRTVIVVTMIRRLPRAPTVAFISSTAKSTKRSRAATECRRFPFSLPQRPANHIAKSRKEFQASKKPLDGRGTLAHNPSNPSQIRTVGMTELRIAKADVDSIAVS